VAVNYSSALKSTRMAAVITAIDAHASPATLEIATAGYVTVLCSITLADPSFTESGGVITMASMPRSNNASNTGTAAVARIKQGDGTTVIVNNLTVGTSATDIILNAVAITSGQTVTFSGSPPCTITHAA
jgi:hypothetical protein